MKKFKRIISIIMIAALIAGVAVVSTLNAGAAATGAGLAEWALNAYYSGWTYVWGGASPGAVDCSGLIYSYCGGNRTSMLADAQANGRDWGYVSSGIPRVHGLGLSRPGHVGVYIGDGMEVDARGTGYNMCYEAVGGSWSCWFKLTAVSYPTNGWEQFNGNSYYYENGEYIVNTSRTIDGVTYYFDSTGKSSSQGSAASVSDGGSSDNSSSAASVKADDNGPLKNGSQGERVEKLQARLQELGYYNGLVDGDFGDLTEKAFKLFQKQAGLYVDGIAGSDADYLYSDDAPVYSAEKNDAAAEDKSDDLAETGAVEDASEDETEDGEDDVQNDEMCYQNGDYGDEIVPIQQRLIDLGYLDDEADGGYGSNTETAVKDFQNANGLVASGVVDQTTYDALFSDSAIKNPRAKAEKADDDKSDEEKTEEPTAAKRIAAVASTTSSTEVEKNNSALSAKAVAGVTNSISVRKTAASTNLEFILWLAIMIIVMLIAFTIVYAVEKRKARVAAARARRRFQ